MEAKTLTKNFLSNVTDVIICIILDAVMLTYENAMTNMVKIFARNDLYAPDYPTSGGRVAPNKRKNDSINAVPNPDVF